MLNGVHAVLGVLVVSLHSLQINSFTCQRGHSNLCINPDVLVVLGSHKY